MNTLDNNQKNTSLHSQEPKERFIKLPEKIILSLSPSALKIYCILSLDTDFDKDWSEVNKNIKYLMVRSGMKRTKLFEALNEIEQVGLIQRISNTGVQSTYRVAKQLNYFNNQPEPVQNTNDPVQNTNDPVQNTDTITNIYSNIIPIFKKKNIKKKNSENENTTKGASVQKPTAVERIRTPDLLITKDTVKKSASYGLNELQSNNPFEIPKQLLSEWLEIRNEKRKKVTERNWRRINTELGLCREKGINPSYAFEKMVDRGWLSLEADWFTSRPSNPTPPSQWTVESVWGA